MGSKLHRTKTNFSVWNYANSVKTEFVNAISPLFIQCHGDLNKTWKNIKMILHGSTTSQLPMEFIYNNNSVLGSKNIVETFNQYFF